MAIVSYSFKLVVSSCINSVNKVSRRLNLIFFEINNTAT